jgi:hypothetical protein
MSQKFHTFRPAITRGNLSVRTGPPTAGIVAEIG